MKYFRLKSLKLFQYEFEYSGSQTTIIKMMSNIIASARIQIIVFIKMFGRVSEILQQPEFFQKLIEQSHVKLF